MPLFKVQGKKTERIHSSPFQKEKELQRLVEDNTEEMFGITFIKSEYPTASGRIDTLGVDENGSPVIIEYKKGKSPNIAAQALFYLNWLLDHKAQIEKDIKNEDQDVEIDWNADVRVLLIAQKFDKYTRKAVNQMKPKIELKKYIHYKNDMLYIEDVTPGLSGGGKKIKSSSRGESSVEDLVSQTGEVSKPIFNKLREEINNLGEDITEKPVKHYLAYRVDRNFVELIPQKNQIRIQLDIPLDELEDPQNKCRDLTDKGHWGTGDTKLVVENEDEIDYALKLVKQSYNYSR